MFMSDGETVEQVTSGEVGQGQRVQIQSNQPEMSSAASSLYQRLRRTLEAADGNSERVVSQLDALVNEFGRERATQQVQYTALQSQLTSVDQRLTQLQHDITTSSHVGRMSQIYPQATAASRAQAKLKVELPAKFDGMPSKLKAFVFEVTQYGKIKDLNDYDVAAVAVTLFAGKVKTWWLTFASAHPRQCEIGNMSWSDLVQALENEFTDEDRERKLLAKFETFAQRGDLATYVANFRTLRMELGNLVTEEAVLWRFISGLKYDLKREVLRERNLSVVGDAILAAERADAVEKFARFGVKGFPHKGKQVVDESVPMDLDALQHSNQGHYQRRNASSSRGGFGGNRGRASSSRGGFSGRTGRANQQFVMQSDEGCFYCGKKGHWARNCFKKQQDQGKGKRLSMVQEFGLGKNAAQGSLPPPPPAKN